MSDLNLDALRESNRFSAERMAKNIPESGMEAAKNIYQTVRHPLQTAGAIVKVAGGAISKAYPGEATAPGDIEAEAALKTAWEGIVRERYGSWDKFLRTLESDPVGVAMDVGGLLQSGGGLAAASKAPAVAKAGRIARAAGEVTDPFALTGKAIAGTGAFIKSQAPEFAGFTTATGASTPKEAYFNPSPGLRSAMRGTMKSENIVDLFKDSYSKIVGQVGAEYRTVLKKLQARDRLLSSAEDLTPTERMAAGRLKGPVVKDLDIRPTLDALKENLADYRVRVKKSGRLDFSRSTVRNDAEAQRVITQVTKNILEWGKQPGDFSVIGMDTLKHQLDNTFMETSTASKFVESLRDSVNSELITKVPEYGSMVGKYERGMKLLYQIEKTFGNPNRSTADRILRSMTTAMTQDREIRINLLKKMTELTGTDITGPVAGRELHKVFPSRGIAGAFLGTAAIAGTGLEIWADELMGRFIPLFAIASPRVVGEFFHGLGLANVQVNKILAALAIKRESLNKATRFGAIKGPQIGFQAGRIDEELARAGQ